MEKKIFFMIENALKTKEKILNGKRGPTNLYGAVELEKKKVVEIIDANWKNIIKLKSGSVVVINRTKYIPLLKLLGKKVVLIDINSNHDLRENRKTPKEMLLHLFYKTCYNLCNLVVCIANIQEKKLKQIGVKNITVIPLGVDEEIIKKIPKSSGKYYLSIGSDKGRDYDFIAKALRGFKNKITNGSGLSYLEYLKLIAGCKALVLYIDISRKGSSDVSGTTTSYEALLMKKPIFINYQPWLKDLFKDNYHVYKDEKELRELLKKKIGFKKFKDTSHLTLKNFVSNLLMNIEKL